MSAPRELTPSQTSPAQAQLVETDLGGRESRLSSVFASLAEGVAILDPDGRIVQCNASAERILGLTREEILGLTPRDPRWRAIREDGSLLPQDEHPSLITLRTGEPCSGVVIGIHTASGDLRWVSVNSQPLRSAERARFEGVVVSFADITAMRRMTEHLLEAQKLESVARLAGGIAHDFNNLLTAVLSYAELGLAHVEPTSTLAHYLRQIAQSGDRAASLTQQLLAFARRQPVRSTIVDLDEMLATGLDILRAWVGERIHVTLECAPGLWPVFVDRGQMQQLLLNLASNAADAMPEGGSLRVGVRNIALGHGRELPPGDYIEWTMTDNGVGMAAEIVAHVFEPFFTSKDVGEGSGLGLATCYGIVRRHGGAISVRSGLGEGSTFTILLPRASTAVATG